MIETISWNLEEITALASEMFVSGSRPWLKNAACLIKLSTVTFGKTPLHFRQGELNLEITSLFIQTDC